MVKKKDSGIEFHTRKEGCGRSTKSLFKSIDIYGEQIRLSYQGKNTFTTSPGAIVTLLVVAMTLAYGIYRAYILMTLNGTNVSNQSYLYDLTQLDPYTPNDYGFDIAFGVGGALDPTIGFLTVNFVNYYYSEQLNADGSKIRKKLKTPLLIDLCSNVGFDFSDQVKVTEYGINSYYCIQNKTAYYLMGDYYKQNFTYLEIRLNACTNTTANNNSCQSQDAINTFVDTKQMSIAFINTFFDFNDYTE